MTDSLDTAVTLCHSVIIFTYLFLPFFLSMVGYGELKAK